MKTSQRINNFLKEHGVKLLEPALHYRCGTTFRINIVQEPQTDINIKEPIQDDVVDVLKYPYHISRSTLLTGWARWEGEGTVDENITTLCHFPQTTSSNLPRVLKYDYTVCIPQVAHILHPWAHLPSNWLTDFWILN